MIWPHNLTLSRLVSRSLRRRDKSIFQLEISNHEDYWLGVLIPLCLQSFGAVLVVTSSQKNRLFQVEIPRLKEEGLTLPIWEGADPPLDGKVWVLDFVGFVNAFRKNHLSSRQLIIPEGEFFSRRIREAMAIHVSSSHWDCLRRAYPSTSSALINLYERLSRRLFSQAIRPDALVRIDLSDVLRLKDLLGVLPQPPAPWADVLDATNQRWASWAELDYKLLDWTWHLQPLEPLHILHKLFIDNPFVLLSGAFQHELGCLDTLANVKVKLGSPIYQDPIKLFVPYRQPLPNAECFTEHLLEQSRRLILGRQGLTVILLDDLRLLRQLTSELASEFGTRVVYESTAPDSNGVICCTSSWWLASHIHLPSPEQLILALLPISSLETPLTASRVEAFKQQGRDWFRDLLLPECLGLLPRLVLPVRKNQGRIAVLDGRLRSRAWGMKVFDALEPWTPLERLLPD
ncbi:helicase [Prochlorococcus marinus]|uniref:helicase n=1 Tax=Prochlorococcus marinus TaxID=1219 RepID=UPI0030B86A30